MSYGDQRAAIIADLQGKLQREDWHGVADAANDLRELDAFERGRREPQTAPSCPHPLLSRTLLGTGEQYCKDCTAIVL